MISGNIQVQKLYKEQLLTLTNERNGDKEKDVLQVVVSVNDCYSHLIKGAGERKIRDIVVVDMFGIIHSVDYFSAADFSGSVELRFVKCLPFADISDKYFDFDSVCGKMIATEIILFILSLISKR